MRHSACHRSASTDRCTSSGSWTPLCGMTRGVAAATRGDLAGAVRFNPASPIVVLTRACGIARGVLGRTRGQWLELRLRATRGMILAAAVLVLALAVRQQMNAPLLAG
ncbi:MAG: DUF2752 domain-containing protein [Acidimicrobiales bacterium]